MANAKRVLVVGCNRHFCWQVVTALGLAGVNSEVMTLPRFAPVRFSRYCKRFTTLPDEYPRFTPTQMLEYLRPHIRTDHAAVIPVDLSSVLTIGHGLGSLPCPVFPVSPPDVTELLHDKHRFGELLESHGIPTPKTHLLLTAADFDAADIPFPAMIKPLIGHGSEGIKKFETRDAMRQHLATLPANRFPLLVQQFAHGDLLGLNVLSDRGRVVAWTIQNQGHPGFNYTLLENDRLLELGRRICEITGYHGVANFDTIHNPITGEIFFLECNPRIWASMSVSTWTGVNFPHLALRTALGEDAAPHFKPVTGSSIYVRRFPFGVFLRSLCRGRLMPPGMTPPSVAAYKHALSNLLPHIVDRFVHNAAAQASALGLWSEPTERFQTTPYCPDLPPGSPTPAPCPEAPRPAANTSRPAPTPIRRTQQKI